jgi:GH24 family phage-related lysozyme (muramidase)
MYNSEPEYTEAVVELISHTEGHLDEVTDTKDGEVTIGYGYTFGRNNNVELWTIAEIPLTATQLSVLRRVDAAETIEEKNLIAFSEFTRKITYDQARALLKHTCQKYEGPAEELQMPLSPERAAFVSIVYSQDFGDSLSSNMIDFYQAIRDGNRAEAWFQIRYKALGSSAPMFVYRKAKRRYLESQIFGLYDNPQMTDIQEASSVFKMFQRHRDEICDHESRFGKKINGENGHRNMIDEGNNDPHYRLLLNHFGLERIETISMSLESGKSVLLTNLRTCYLDT